MHSEEPEYVSSVTLMILRDELDPDSVTQRLNLQPDRAWHSGGRHGWGGWKKHLPKEAESEELAEQIAYWSDLLKSRSGALTELKEEGCYLALSCFVTPTEEEGGTASICLSPELLASASALGLACELSFQS